MDSRLPLSGVTGADGCPVKNVGHDGWVSLVWSAWGTDPSPLAQDASLAPMTTVGHDGWVSLVWSAWGTNPSPLAQDDNFFKKMMDAR